MHPFIATVIEQRNWYLFLVLPEGAAGCCELNWKGSPDISVGDRIYVTPESEGEDDLVVALYVAVLNRRKLAPELAPD